MGGIAPIETVEVNRHGCLVTVELSSEIPSCCPRSKNPFPDSFITIRYQPEDKTIEIGAFKAAVWQYRGGLYDETDNLIVRSMEDMICHLAYRCAQAVGVPVTAWASLILLPRHTMYLSVTSMPEE